MLNIIRKIFFRNNIMTRVELITELTKIFDDAFIISCLIYDVTDHNHLMLLKPFSLIPQKQKYAFKRNSIDFTFNSRFGINRKAFKRIVENLSALYEEHKMIPVNAKILDLEVK
jgi:hypothetical protein